MRGRILGLAILVILSPSTAAADWLLSPFVGFRFGAATTLIFVLEPPEGRAFTWGVSGGVLTDGVLGLEVDFSYVPGFFDAPLSASSRVITLSGNAILTLPLSATTYGLRPYATGGLGLMHASSRGVSSLGEILLVDSNFLAVNIGGGAIGPVSPRSSLRFDLRYFRNTRTDEDAVVRPGAAGAQLSFWRASVGLTLRFRS